MLGLAFHPQYATNRELFVSYTTHSTQTTGDAFFDMVVRYTASATDPNVADPASATPILAIPDFAQNHNAGMLEFGPDGYLYISTGDGGDSGDPRRNAQATSLGAPNCTANHCEPLLGKMLRIDVDHPQNGKPYGIPADNPFANSTTEDFPEIYMLGLRNPWRWSFDRGTGDMWIGDVGQEVVEEVDYVPAGQQAGVNFGWSMYEGSNCCVDETGACAQKAPQQPCDPTGKMFPNLSHLHTSGFGAVIGGQVYRGRCYPDLVGKYFYTDFRMKKILRASVDSGTLAFDILPGLIPEPPASLHADAAGELYVTGTQGGVYHVEAGP